MSLRFAVMYVPVHRRRMLSQLPSDRGPPARRTHHLLSRSLRQRRHDRPRLIVLLASSRVDIFSSSQQLELSSYETTGKFSRATRRQRQQCPTKDKPPLWKHTSRRQGLDNVNMGPQHDPAQPIIPRHLRLILLHADRVLLVHVLS